MSNMKLCIEDSEMRFVEICIEDTSRNQFGWQGLSLLILANLDAVHLNKDRPQAEWGLHIDLDCTQIQMLAALFRAYAADLERRQAP